jgi:hypothetical protein
VAIQTVVVAVATVAAFGLFYFYFAVATDVVVLASKNTYYLAVNKRTKYY